MSIASHNPGIVYHHALHRGRAWILAVLAPALLAPLWFTLLPVVPVPLRSFSGLLLTLLLSVAMVTDLSRRKIFNWTTYTGLGWAIAVNLFPPESSLGMMSGSIGITNSLIGAIACFAVMLVPYTLARGGAGDVKLAAAVGGLLGMDEGLLVIAFTYIVAGVAITGWSIWAAGPRHLLSATFRKFGACLWPRWINGPSPQQKRLLNQPVPLGGFFAMGTALVVFDIPRLLESI